jgi:hypothetical protein
MTLASCSHLFHSLGQSASFPYNLSSSAKQVMALILMMIEEITHTFFKSKPGRFPRFLYEIGQFYGFIRPIMDVANIDVCLECINTTKSDMLLLAHPQDHGR